MDYYSVGKRIRKYRKAQGISQEQLAEKVDISVTHMSHIETGNTKLSLSVLVKIATALAVQTDDLLFEAPTDRTVSIREIADILDSCTPKQIKVITDLVRTAKISLDKYD